MNPNSFKSSNEFNVDDEIAKLWSDLEKEFSEINAKVTNNGSGKVFNPPTVSVNTPKREEKLEIPRFPNDNTAEFNPQVLNEKKEQKLPPTIGSDTVPDGPKIPHFNRRSDYNEPEAGSTTKKEWKLPPTIISNSDAMKQPEQPEVPHIPKKPDYSMPNFVKGTQNAESPKSQIPPLFDTEKAKSDHSDEPAMPIFSTARQKHLSENQKNTQAAYEIPDIAMKSRRNLESTHSSGEKSKAEKIDIANKATKTMVNTQNLRKKIVGIFSENVDEIKTSSSESLERAREALDEKYQIFKEKIHENKESMRNTGKKAVAVILAALTIGGAASAIGKAHRERPDHFSDTTANEDQNKIDREYSTDSFRLKENIDEDTGERQVVAFINSTENISDETEPSTQEEKVEESSNRSETEPSTVVETEPTVVAEVESVAEETKDEDVTEPEVSQETEETAEAENKSEIKDDMKLGIRLTEYMKNEMSFIKKTYKENIETYKRIVEKIKEDTGIDIPTEAICAIHYRESRCDFDSYLQNGDPLGQVTTHVPKGLYFENFFDSAVAAIESQLKEYQDYDKVDFYSMKGLCKFTNRYNGFGSQRYYGLPSSYVYTGTSKYQGGMYVADGSFRENKEDPRMGTYPIISELANLS